ncbi:MAG: SH3 domain-containing protein [Nitrosomonas sp.]|nr:SH3 domain-containing protein [Nitrosomonas sp.]
MMIIPIIFMYRETSDSGKLQHVVLSRLLSASLVVVSIGLSGCASYQSDSGGVRNVKTAPVPKRITTRWPSQRVVIPVPERIPTVKVYQHEIVRLKQLLAEKDKLIQGQAAKEQNPLQTQEQVLRGQASGVDQSKGQQYRLATKPETASKIAEVEVSLSMLKQSDAATRNPSLLTLAQSLLDVALQAYERADFSQAMSYAAQSQECIEMTARLTEKTYEQQPTAVVLRTPLLLQTRKKESLRTAPGNQADTQGMLAQNTAVTATTYHGYWLRIETRDGRSGWIWNQSIDARVNPPALPER